MRIGSKCKDDTKNMAIILTHQCKSFLTASKDIPSKPLKPPENGNSLSEITITEEDIKEAIDNMTVTSVPAPYGITTSIYKEYADKLIYPIKKMWQASLEIGKLPDSTSQAIITAIYKDGVKNNHQTIDQ